MLTELEAINQMLGTIRESPVSTLEGTLPEEALLAKNVLDEVSADVQRVGWAFNIDKAVVLVKDTNGHIALADDVLRIRVDPTTVLPESHDPVTRGQRLYNRATNTYVFTKNVTANVWRHLAWTNIPDTARKYIAMRAARIFSNRVLGSSKTEQDATQEEMRAQRELRREHGQAARPNMLNSPGVAPLAWRNSEWV